MMKQRKGLMTEKKKNDTQKNYRLGTVSKKWLLEGLSEIYSPSS